MSAITVERHALTIVCFGCGDAHLTIDDSDMPGGRTGWTAFLAAVASAGWSQQPISGSPYPDYLCQACASRSPSPPPPSPRPQLDLFA